MRLVYILGLVPLSACSIFSGYPTSFQDNGAVIAANAPYLTPDVRTRGNDPSDTARDGLSKQEYRNTVVYRRIEVIDINYYEFEQKLSGAYGGIDMAADLTALILNGLGATTGSAATKAALAAASAGVIGAKGAINTDLFYQKTLPTIVTEMHAARQQARVNIEKGISLTVDQYPLDQALADVNAYYVAGTLPGAISQVTAQAGVALQSADEQLAAIRTQKYTAPTPTASRIIAWLYPGGDQAKPPISGNLTKLTKWMQTDPIDPKLASVPYVLLLNGSDASWEPDRVRAIQSLNIP